MIKVNVQITGVSGERFWEITKPLPPVQINTNLNLITIEKKDRQTLEVPFILTVNYNPSVAQLSLKGKAYVKGDEKEIADIYSKYKEKQPPPTIIVQSISNVAFVESVVISRTLNLPPPIPLPQIPPAAKGKSDKERPEASYTA
ncbi:hypothetical protein H5T51_02170 [Candidatus Bathyarchaeota archaeon]|nr:hypothetical protein [Candidatus Bathyarchaeota archaeon]